jgi:hypothetical protein
MKKTYYVAPLAALALFIVAFVISRSGETERAAAKAAAVLAERESRIAAEKEARDIAIAEALVIQEQRKKERLEREAREAAEREARNTAIDARDAAFREQERLKRDTERLRREIAAETEIVTRLQRDHDDLLAEKKHLEALAPRTAATAAELERVLRQIATAEAARAKAAAEAAKSKS